MGPVKDIALGIQDYRKIREYNYYYVDKTRMISEFLRRGGRGHSDHASAQIWKDAEYVYAGRIFGYYKKLRRDF